MHCFPRSFLNSQHTISNKAKEKHNSLYHEKLMLFGSICYLFRAFYTAATSMTLLGVVGRSLRCHNKTRYNIYIDTDRYLYPMYWVGAVFANQSIREALLIGFLVSTIFSPVFSLPVSLALFMFSDVVHHGCIIVVVLTYSTTKRATLCYCQLRATRTSIRSTEPALLEDNNYL